MKKNVAFAMMFMIGVIAAHAQQGPPVTSPPDEMAPLAQLAGEWEGTGTAMVPEGQQHFRQTEDVVVAINGHALVIQGLGVHEESSTVVHDALAVITWDQKAGEYRVDAWKANGSYVQASGRMEGENFIWGFGSGGGTVRFTIDLSDPDRWLEIGEYSRDGESWMKFLEMELARK